LAASLLVWQTFAVNRKYGEHGLIKQEAGEEVEHDLHDEGCQQAFRKEEVLRFL